MKNNIFKRFIFIFLSVAMLIRPFAVFSVLADESADQDIKDWSVTFTTYDEITDCWGGEVTSSVSVVYGE